MRNVGRPERRQQILLAQHLRAGESVVVDNTNASVSVRAPLVALAHELGAEVIAYFFDTPVEDALRRNRAREGRERVPDVAIFTARKRLEPPSRAEGFDQLYTVHLRDLENRLEIVPL